MRPGTWATVIAIIVIIAIGWWAIDWTTDEQRVLEQDPVAEQAPPPPLDDPAAPGDAPGETGDNQQTIGEPAPPPAPVD